MKNFRHHKKYNSGFTIIETMEALAIFTFAVLTLVVVLAQGLSDTGYAKKKMVAEYLAQEGPEYIRNIRDTLVLYNAATPQAGWNNFSSMLTNAGCNQSDGCYFNADSLNFSDKSQPILDISLNPCPGGTCPNLRYNSATGKYNYDSAGSVSDYIRKINITQISADEIKVSTTVYWTQKSGNYQLTFSETLFNWVE